MPETTRKASPIRDSSSIHVLLERTIDALTHLDADTIEDLLGECPFAAEPESPLDWRRAARAHRVLANLLGATAGHIDMLKRVSEVGHQSCVYAARKTMFPESYFGISESLSRR